MEGLLSTGPTPSSFKRLPIFHRNINLYHLQVDIWFLVHYSTVTVTLHKQTKKKIYLYIEKNINMYKCRAMHKPVLFLFRSFIDAFMVML